MLYRLETNIYLKFFFSGSNAFHVVNKIASGVLSRGAFRVSTNANEFKEHVIRRKFIVARWTLSRFSNNTSRVTTRCDTTISFFAAYFQKMYITLVDRGYTVIPVVPARSTDYYDLLRPSAATKSENRDFT